MARPASGTNFNIAQLERVLQEKKSELNKLLRQRNQLQKKLGRLDRLIERVEGGMNGSRRSAAGGGTGSRARNSQSLLEAMEGVLREAGKPMKVADIMQAVLDTGYRSTSDNFRGIVNQTLIKDKRFGQVARGIYGLKSSGESRKKDRSKSAA